MVNELFPSSTEVSPAITLTRVEHDPFAVTPVDHDPFAKTAQASPMLQDPKTGKWNAAPVYKEPTYTQGKTPKQGDVPDMAGEALQYRNSGKLPPWTLPRTTESQTNGVKVYEFEYPDKAGYIGTPEYKEYTKQMHDLLKNSRPGDKVLLHGPRGEQIWLENTVDPDGGALDGGSVDPDRASYWGSWSPPEAGV